MFYGISPFFIVLVAIVGYFTYRIVDVHYRSKRDLSASAGGADLKRLVEDNTAANKQVLAKLDALEARVAGVEKTLNDIPS